MTIFHSTPDPDDVLTSPWCNKLQISLSFHVEITFLNTNHCCWDKNVYVLCVQTYSSDFRKLLELTISRFVILRSYFEFTSYSIFAKDEQKCCKRKNAHLALRRITLSTHHTKHKPDCDIITVSWHGSSPFFDQTLSANVNLRARQLFWKGEWL